MDYFVAKYELKKTGDTYCLNGEIPIDLFEKEKISVADCLSRSICLCGPFRRVNFLIIQGAKVFIVFGTCGVLDCSISHSRIILPTKAVRDEGTSYHYRVSTDEVTLLIKESTFMKRTFANRKIPFIEATTWTTDALYRETEMKIQR